MSFQTDKNKKKIIQWIIPSIVLIAFILYTTFSFEKSMEAKITDDVISEFQNALANVVADYERDLAISSDICSSAEKHIEEKNLFDNRDAFLGVIDGIDKSNYVKKAYYMNSNGELIDGDGKKSSVLKTIGFNASTFTGSGSIFMEPSMNEYISYSVGNNGGIILICDLKPLSRTKIVSGNSIASGNSVSFALINKDFVVMEFSGGGSKNFEVGNDFFAELGSISYLEGSQKRIVDVLISGGAQMAHVVDSKNIGKYILVDKIDSLDGAAVLIVSEDQVNKIVTSRNKDTRTLVLKVIICMAVFVGALVLISILNMANVSIKNKDLQEQAETDLLTDLYNKITTEKKIEEYLSGEGKNKIGMMFLLDIDNFKKINDTMGHAFGDEVLSELGHQLRAEFRVTDIVGRLGGDEFVIFLKDLKDSDTMNREARRVEQFFKNFKVGEYTKYAATASIGAVVVPRDGTSFEMLYKCADQALYKAKKRGKKQLAYYREIDENGAVIETEEDREAAEAIAQNKTIDRD